MYLFHAITNTHLINIVQAKMTIFKNKDADLFIIDSMRISKNLVEQIKKRDIFRKVVSIPSIGSNPIVVVPAKPKIIQQFGNLLNATHEINCIKKQMQNAISDTKYSRIFVAHFGDDSKLLLSLLISLGNNIRISLLEEGSGWLYMNMKHWHITGRVRPRYIKFTTHCPYSIEKIYEKYLDDFYFYQPEYYSSEEHLKTQKLRKITDRNSVTQEIMRTELKGIDISEYNNRRIIYFESAKESSSYESQQRDIETILSVYSPNEVLIKHHPKAKPTTVNSKKIVSPYPTKVFVDTRTFFLESLLAEIPLEDKLLITSCSGTVLSPKYMFEKEPYVMFTNLIAESVCNTFTEKTIYDLVDCYEDKSKVLIPKTVDEMRTMLSKFKDTINGY